MIGVFGTGLSAACFRLGLNISDDVIFFQPRLLEIDHYSSLSSPGGLAGYWHKGLMSPGWETIKDLGVEDYVARKFNYQLGLKLDFHETKSFMMISNKPRNFFKVAEFLSYKVISVERRQSHFLVSIDGISYKLSKIVLALGTIGNLEFLKSTGLADSHTINNTQINDHFMSASGLELNKGDGTWWVEGRGLAQQRESFFTKGVNFSSRVSLLTLPYIGKILYGIVCPKLAFDTILKRFLVPRTAYKFMLKTPKEPVYLFKQLYSKTSNNKQAGAFHVIGSSSFSDLDSIEGVEILSGNFLPLDYKYFPSYLIGLRSYSRGVASSSRSQLI